MSEVNGETKGGIINLSYESRAALGVVLTLFVLTSATACASSPHPTPLSSHRVGATIRPPALGTADIEAILESGGSNLPITTPTPRATLEITPVSDHAWIPSVDLISPDLENDSFFMTRFTMELRKLGWGYQDYRPDRKAIQLMWDGHDGDDSSRFFPTIIISPDSTASYSQETWEEDGGNPILVESHEDLYLLIAFSPAGNPILWIYSISEEAYLDFNTGSLIPGEIPDTLLTPTPDPDATPTPVSGKRRFLGSRYVKLDPSGKRIPTKGSRGFF